MKKLSKKQKGFTLIISLMLLAGMSLMVASTVNLNSVDLQISFNTKVKSSLTYSAIQAMEQVVSDVSKFYSPTDYTATVNGNSVTVHTAECLGSVPVGGYSAGFQFAPEDTYWRVKSTSTDANSGANITVYQGLRIKLPADNCN